MGWTAVTRLVCLLEEVTPPVSRNLCMQEFSDLQTCYEQARLTQLPFPSAVMPSLFDSQDATGNTQEKTTSASLGSVKRDGRPVAEEHHNRRQLRRTAS